MLIDIKRLHPKAILPKYGSDGAAGMDLHACFGGPPVVINPGEHKMIPTGIGLDMSFTGMVGLVFPRSGLGAKQGIVLGNLTGVIDSDYQGEIQVCLWNRNQPGDYAMNDDMKRAPAPFFVSPGDRIAQIVFMPIYRVSWREVQDFGSASDRGANGFGSTGR